MTAWPNPESSRTPPWKGEERGGREGQWRHPAQAPGTPRTVLDKNRVFSLLSPGATGRTPRPRLSLVSDAAQMGSSHSTSDSSGLLQAPRA